MSNQKPTAASMPELADLAAWVLAATPGDARAVGMRADGNDVVTVKQYVNSAVVRATEFHISKFRKFAGLPPRRVVNNEDYKPAQVSEAYEGM